MSWSAAATISAAEEGFATRVLLESWAVRVAAASPDRGQYEKAEELLNSMDDTTLAPEDFHRLDAEFHVEMTRQAGNVERLLALVPVLVALEATGDTRRWSPARSPPRICRSR